MIPVRTLYVDLFQIIGTALPNCTVRMALSHYDIVDGTDGGLVPAGITDIACDVDGKGEGELFPNVLGTQGTSYAVQVYNDSGAQVFPEKGRAFAVMPDADSQLHAILFNTPTVAKSDLERAVVEARAWAVKEDEPVELLPVPLYSAKYYASSVAQSTQAASEWATFTGGEVPNSPPGSRSAKSWAQDNLIGVTYGGSAKDWAMGAGLIDGTTYKSARGYMLDAVAIAQQTTLDVQQTGLDRIQTGADRAQTSQDRIATGQDRVATGGDVALTNAAKNESTTQATNSAASALTSLAASATAGAYPNSAGTNVPRGVQQAGVGAITAGAGGTNGTYMNGTTTGGNFLVPPTFKYVVAGGVLTSVTILNEGLYIGAAPSVGTPTFTGSNLVGAGVVLTPNFNTPNDGYWVVSADNTTLDRYLNVGGVATRDLTVPSMPTATSVGQAMPGYSWSVQDGGGNDAIAVRTDGTTEMCSADVEQLNGMGRDRLRNILLPSDLFMPADIIGFFLYGDSIAEAQIDNVKRLVTDSTQPYGNLRFDTGVRSQDSVAAPTSLIPLVEQIDPIGTVKGETIGSGMLNELVELIAAENGLPYGDYGPVFFVSAPAAGGSYIANLQKGSGIYTRMMTDITNAKALANAAGKTFAVGAVIMIEGTNSMGQLTPIATWKTLTAQLIADINTDVKALIPGQPNIPMVALQTNNHPSYAQYVNNPIIAQAGRELAAINPLYFNACSLQQGDEWRTPQAVHKTALGMRWMGALTAHAVKRLCIDRKPPSNLDLELAWGQGNVVIAQFKTEYPPIAFDARWTLMQTNMGFRVTGIGTVNAYGPGPGTTNPITSVKLAGPKQVRIVCTNPITAGMRLQVGTAGRSNVRDSRGDIHTYVIEGVAHRLDNFALIADQIIVGV